MTYRSTSKNKVFTIILLALLILQGGVFGAVNAVEPLRISNVEVTTTDKTATITWYTNQASDGMIEYEYHEDFNPNTDDYRFHLQSGEPNSTMHEITLYSLVPETEYHFRIVSRNSLAEVKSFDQVFETEELGDNSAPNITRVQAAYVTGTTATIQWETDELANSVVEYGSTTSYGSTRSDGARLILHDITITGLQPGNTYHFRVKSTDNKDNTSISPDRSFRTDITQGGEKETLYITGLTPVSSNDPDVTETSAKISYRTNKLANCKVSYGTSTSFRHSKSCPKPRNFLHEVTINDLNPNTRYYYEVESVDVFGVRITSATNSFTTRGGEPAINNLIIENNVAESEIFFYVSYDTTVHADRASGNSRAIINNNSYLTNQNSISGQSLVIDNNSNVAYESHNNINNERGTIAFWFRPNWNGNDNIGHTLFDFSTGEDNSVDSNYFMLDKDKNNNFRFWLENSSDNDFQKITYNASSIRANQWYHIAITYDYANGIADFYLDGQKVASDKPHGTPFTFNKYFYIGGPAIDYVASRGSADGLIDELKTYGRVLMLSEIQSLANHSIIDVSQTDQGQILGASTFDYTQAKALYKEEGSPRVYAIFHNGQKHYIASPSVFDSYGYSWADVETVPVGTLDQYRDAHLVKTPERAAVYYLYLGKMIRKVVPSPLVFNSYQRNEWADIITISEVDLSFYPEALLVQDIDQDPIYFLENNTILREIQNEQAYADLGVSKDSVAIINYTHLSTFIMSEPLQ